MSRFKVYTESVPKRVMYRFADEKASYFMTRRVSGGRGVDLSHKDAYNLSDYIDPRYYYVILENDRVPLGDQATSLDDRIQNEMDHYNKSRTPYNVIEVGAKNANIPDKLTGLIVDFQKILKVTENIGFLDREAVRGTLKITA